MQTRSRAALLLVTLTAVVIGSAGRTTAAADSFAITLFEQYVESLRKVAGIPGLSATIVQNGQIVWERGFGFQDVENSIRARPDTPYPVGGLTETFSATLLLQCVERGRLELDEPMSTFSERVPTAGARVRHVLSHSSDATPGERFKYDPSRYAALTEVSNSCTGFGVRKVVVWEILERLSMFDSVPGADVLNAAVVPPSTFQPPWPARFARTLDRMAVPYRISKKGDATRLELPQTSFDTATGLISTVRDLAQFDKELSNPVLLAPESLSLAWSNVRTSGGAPLPAGLGWFVQAYEGEKIVWQFGAMEDGYSSMFLRIPSRNLTLIMLANSDGLSAPFQLSSGDVTTSPFAKVFLKLFVV
jgi:CubicO group peptidase (beta-lactamase class C family)